jgi:hypothetical protein
MSKARQLADLGNQVDDGAITGTNMVVNGGMTVAQRGTSFTSPSNIYTLDRWFSTDNTGASVTVSQDSDAPNGFTNSAKITVNTPDTSLATNSACLLRQNIEGVNFSQCSFGSGSAKDITISFWVKSSITGQYSVAINNSSYDRSYVTGYTVSSANTWEYKSVKIAGDTSGTWLTSFSIGAAIHFPVAVEAGKVTSGDAWTSGFNYGVTGQVNFVGTSGATFQITGVCLNVGDSAIDFPHDESYGETLAKCQRYFQKSFQQSTAPVAGEGSTDRIPVISWSSSYCGGYTVFPVRMRATPSIALYRDNTSGTLASGSINVYTGAAWVERTATAARRTETGFTLDAYASGAFAVGNGYISGFNYTADAEL